MTDAVIVVGSLNVDLIVRVPHLPTPGETVTGGTYARTPGGKGANQAAAAARLGAPTWIVGVVGDDDLGRETRADLEARGVDLSQLRSGTAHTGVAAIMVDEGGENLIAVASGANAELSPAMVSESIAAIPVDRAVVLANLEIPDDAVLAAADCARQHAWRFVLNPAPPRALSAELLATCDVLIPNEHEVTSLGPPDADALLAAGVGAVVVTRGSAGADLHHADAPIVHQGAFPVAAVDTTGAGDAFCAAFAWALAEGLAEGRALQLAAAAGALATRAVGARESLPDRAEIEGIAGSER